MKTEQKIKTCPICQALMVTKGYEHPLKIPNVFYYVAYCRRCGYGLDNAFSSRIEMDPFICS